MKMEDIKNPFEIKAVAQILIPMKLVSQKTKLQCPVVWAP